MSPQAVVKRLMTDVPFGVLLSGGLDGAGEGREAGSARVLYS